MNDNLRIAAEKISMANLFEDDMDAAKEDRDAAIWRARHEDGIGPTEIALHLTMSLSNVRRIIHEENVRRGRRP